METGFQALYSKFQVKGFLPIEIPGLIEDVAAVLDNDKYFTISDINQELEDLGWGVNIIDDATFQVITSMVQ